MTLEIQGLHFGFRFTEPYLQSQTWAVLASYGFHLTPHATAELSGLFKIRAVETLLARPPGLRNVGVDNNGVGIWQEGDFFWLETPRAAFAVDLAAGEVRGSVLASRQSVGAPLMWLTLWSLNLLLCGYGYFPLHAAALTPNGGDGLVATGESGSGKSTLACNLLREGWQFLSDDTVLLHPVADHIEVCAFRLNFSLREKGEALFPDLVAQGQERPAGERKHWVPVRTLYPDQAADACIPRVLVFPELPGEGQSRAESRLVPLRPVEALHRLVGQSALVRFRRDWAEEHLALLQRLIGQASSYRLEAGRDLIEQPRRTHDLLAPLLSHHAEHSEAE